ncbi:thiamine phosphate synthase [Paenibacillus herberti]|uniref:Thiamine-phosphate synthase n=1 Tax=Paenibacillus herberti TaxID=1619309 RepID=A0A229P5J7_9BACL|nr:thiamine phosphate synthase [Paenibacillus herberti]OXM17119.1 thiamine-phosphate pyrophosphorylase [Paenibacillus herberti]
MKKLDFSLYVITAENYHPGKTMEEVMREALYGGADIVQLRHKTAKESELLEKARLLRGLTREFGVPFIVNDYPQLAIEADADGVHVGQEDHGLREARELLGPDRIVGVSTHSLDQAMAAEDGGADYIGVGPVYPTGTKPGRPAVTLNYVRQAARHVRIPWVAIGGIHLGNAQEVLDAGATRLCAVSAIVGSEDPAAVCRSLKAMISSSVSGAGEAEIMLNGGRHRTGSMTLQQLVEEKGLTGRRIVAEADGTIVPREEWSGLRLRSGMTVELVHFVGGG